MKVEVETADIHALETQVREVSVLLATVVSKRKGGTITFTDLAEGTVTVDSTDDGLVLTYKEE